MTFKQVWQSFTAWPWWARWAVFVIGTVVVVRILF